MKTVVITGANRGIGLGFVTHYISEGWTVFALHRGELNEALKNLSSTDNNNIYCLNVDLSDGDSICNVANDITKLSTGVDLLINNAGLAEHELFGELTQQALMNSYQINTVAPALLTQALAEQLNVNAKVIQLSSGLASIKQNNSPLSEFDGYCMSKAALNMLTRRLASKFLEKKIVVNAISPGWVKTEMGGDEAPTTVLDAVCSITQTINELTLNNSGCFMDEKGEVIEW